MVDANTILSGLFFRGNERHLLGASVRREVTLVYPEDVVEEVFDVIGRSFSAHPDLPSAFAFMEDLFAVGELVSRETYQPRVRTWAGRLRDPTDSPVLACAEAVRADAVVTGDRDILEFEGATAFRLLRTKEVLRELK